MKKFFSKLWAGIKEAARKFMVSLKRQPSNIPLVALALNFLIYPLNLTDISDPTAKIQGNQMGLCGFVTMLFSILMLVCFLNAFPKRKKVNIPMLVLVFLMIGLVAFADIYYLGRINYAINRPENAIILNDSTLYVVTAQRVLRTHIIMLGVSVVLIAALPIYKKLLQKVKTSIEVEGNADMGNIDFSEEE